MFFHVVHIIEDSNQDMDEKWCHVVNSNKGEDLKLIVETMDAE
jgi:hypothetical protein